MSVKFKNKFSNSNNFNYPLIVNDQSKKIHLRLDRIKSAIQFKSNHRIYITNRNFSNFKYGPTNKHLYRASKQRYWQDI